MTDNEYKELLKGRLSEYRYIHSLGVCSEAVRLAKKYGANERKAYLAGLLHDVMKDASKEEQLKTIEDDGIIISKVEKKTKKLWHAISGAAYIKNVLNIDDDEIIGAVRYHTTAKAKMTLLEKVIYLADFTSADRDYEDVDVMRRLVDEDIDKAMMYGLSHTITELVEKQSPIHPDTIKAYNEYALYYKKLMKHKEDK